MTKTANPLGLVSAVWVGPVGCVVRCAVCQKKGHIAKQCPIVLQKRKRKAGVL
jgi:hypothetical protein